MKKRIVNLKEGELLEVRIDGVPHVFAARSADGEWLNVQTKAVNLGIASDSRAASEIEKHLTEAA